MYGYHHGGKGIGLATKQYEKNEEKSKGSAQFHITPQFWEQAFCSLGMLLRIPKMAAGSLKFMLPSYFFEEAEH